MANATFDALSPGYMKMVMESTEMQRNKAESLLATLPKHKGWSWPFLYQYKGVWFYADRLPLVLDVEQHFKAEDSDLLLVTAMKVGTTWLKALAFAITRRHQYPVNDPHHPLLANVSHLLLPNLEFQGIKYLQHSPTFPSSSNVDQMAIKYHKLYHTHLPYSLVENAIRSSECKVVYLFRNPGDTFVSMWKFLGKQRLGEMGDLPLEEAFEMFCNGVNAFGSYWDHVLGYWKAGKARPDRFLFLKYEDLQSDQASQVRKLASFLGFPFSEEEEKEETVEQIMTLCSFDNMRNLEVNKSGRIGDQPNHLFFRNGRVGDASKYLTEEMVKRLNAITEEKFRGCGLVLHAA